MADPTDNEVKIIPPDRSLQAKIGTTDLDQVLSPTVIKAAETRIAESADQFLEECSALMLGVEETFSFLQNTPQESTPLLSTLGSDAFAIKTKSGFGGYTLVSSLAKSLQLHCEKIARKELEAKDLEIIQWHIASMNHMLKAKMKGDGGAVGSAILAELSKLTGDVPKE